MQTGSKNKNRRVYFATLFLMIVVMFVFWNSFYWPYQEISKRKVAVRIITLFGVIVVPLLCVYVQPIREWINNIIKKIVTLFRTLWSKRGKVLLLLGLILVGAALLYGITYVISRFVLGTGYNENLFCTLTVVSVIVVSVTILWKQAGEKVEHVFLVIALSLGMLCIVVTPSRVGVSWDDEIHYLNTLKVSNFLNGIMYTADEKNISEYAKNIRERNGYDRKTEADYVEELNRSYEKQEAEKYAFPYPEISSIPYIPAAAGVMLGRGLNLSYVGVFNLGRIFQLLTYVLLLSLAITKVKYGKVLVAMIGLIPTSIFMAAHYSYDWWVTGFTVLGFAYFIAELQDDKPLENKNALIMVGAIALGCIPKAIYFPILLPLLFMPKKKFKSEKQRKCYYIIIILGVLLLVASFLLPMLNPANDMSDSRGGAGVNATEQIKFILKNPIEYIKILFNFELDYISIRNTSAMLYKFAYVGEGQYHGVMSVLLLLLAFLDKDETEKKHGLVRSSMLIGNMAAIVLATTALYISFTAVGHNTVEGMQGRYLVPTIYPALFALGFMKVPHKIKKNVLTCVPMLIVSALFVYNIFKFCVIPY